MLSLRDKIHSLAEALLKLTLMGRAPARSGVARPIEIEKADIRGTAGEFPGQKRIWCPDMIPRIARERVPTMPNARTKPHAEGARPSPTIGRVRQTRGITHQLLQETLSLFPVCVEMLDATFD